MVRYLPTLALLVLIAVADSASACRWDTDCAVGSRCLKGEYPMHGICAGGLNPGNSNDLRPVSEPLKPWKRTGNTCIYDLDCGIGGQCVRERIRSYEGRLHVGATERVAPFHTKTALSLRAVRHRS